jgi:hypothetical protein
MRNVQSSARRGGEFADNDVTWNRNCPAPVSQLEKGSTAVAKQAALSCWLESAFASGCDGGAVFFGDVAQQVLLAQHPGWQAFSLATFDKMHVRAESGAAANGSIIAMITDMTVLPSTALTS